MGDLASREAPIRGGPGGAPRSSAPGLKHLAGGAFRLLLLASLMVSAGCGEVPSGPPETERPPGDDDPPAVILFRDTLMVGADTARLRVAARDSGLVSAIGYSYRASPVEMIEVTPAAEVTVDLEVPVDEGFHPLRIVARDTSGNLGSAELIVGATRARLHAFVADSVELDETGSMLSSARRVWGTAPGMVRLEYWGSAPGMSRFPGGEIQLGSDPERTFSSYDVSPGGLYLHLQATDAQGVRLATGMTAQPFIANLLLPPAASLFVDESQTAVELRLAVGTRFPPPSPKIQRLDLIEPNGDTRSVQLTPANEIAFDWAPRLTEEITRLEVRAELEGGHVSITSFPVVRVAPPDVQGAFSHVAAMWQHTCALATDGQIHCWGDDWWHYDRLFEPRLVPAPVPALSELGLVRLAGGPTHRCGIDASGVAYCWGKNDRGALGDGTTTARAAPVRVTGDLRFLSIATAWDQTCGLALDQRAYCWGSTGHPFIQQHNSVPVEVPGGIAFSSIVVEGQFCGVSTGGQMYCWSQWTDPAPRAIPAPVQLAQLTKAGQAICALDTAGDVWCLESGSAEGTLSKRVSGFGFVSLSGHCGLTSDARAYCWGSGWLGSGEGQMTSATPVEVAGGLRFRELSVYGGGHHACGLTLADAVYCWGDGDFGQLGNGTRYSVSVPIRARDPAP